MTQRESNNIQINLHFLETSAISPDVVNSRLQASINDYKIRGSSGSPVVGDRLSVEVVPMTPVILANYASLGRRERGGGCSRCLKGKADP